MCELTLCSLGVAGCHCQTWRQEELWICNSCKQIFVQKCSKSNHYNYEGNVQLIEASETPSEVVP